MSTKNAFIDGYNGLKLRTRSWKVDQAKASVIFCHGLFEYAGRWHDEAVHFNQHGYNFLAFDQRTHGESGGKRRSFIKDLDNYVKDFEIFLQSSIEKLDHPFFIFAHSMGALVTCTFLTNSKYSNPLFKGVLLSGPFYKQKNETAPMLQKVAKYVSAIFPTIKTIGIRPNSISRDAEVVKKYINDDLVYTGALYASTGWQMIKHGQEIHNRFEKFDYPFILMHGTDDELAEIESSKLIYEKSPSLDKEFVPLQDYKHEITKDFGKEKVLDKYVDWMDARV